MDAAIDANALLDYIEFHIFPSQNRYEACVYNMNKKEKVKSGLLEHLLLHSAEIRALHSQGSNATYRLNPSRIAYDNKWFTKSTLIRFLHIIGSANILDVTNSLKNEISQLKEARRFHLSLYTKGTNSKLQRGESDGSYSNGMGSTTKAEGSDASKNELLRALDLRLSALSGELTSAFDQAAGSRYSVEEMTDIEKFSQHFGSGVLSDSVHKYIELRQGTQAVENSSSNHFLESERVRSKEGNNHTSESLSSETHVRYRVSPAKVALVERQSSTESDESSFSSEEEQPSIERSRTLIRSASPRRSASPMRRIQIGRSGTRRSTAITIKSLNFIPATERAFLPKDPSANDSDGEGSQQAPKKSEDNVRMSVQDAINLFESKQRDQMADVQKAKSLNASIGAKRSVLRRWSSGMGEDSSKWPQDAFAEDSVTEIQNRTENKEISYSSPESDGKPDVVEDYSVESRGSDAKLKSPEKEASSPVVVQEVTLATESTDVSEKLTASAEWSRQKEAELNELLMKIMETKPVKSRSVVPSSSKRQSLPSEQRGGSYDLYKEKRDERLRGEAARRRAERDKQFRMMQQVVDAKGSRLPSANASDAGKKHNVKQMQKPQKTLTEPANPKTESPKLDVSTKPFQKASSLRATRKSWPSMPSGRISGPSPAKIPPAVSPNGAIPTHRRSQPTPPVSRSSPKVETSQLQTKSVKSNQNDSKKCLGSTTQKKQQSVTKPRKTARSKAQTAPEDLTPAAKHGLRNKVTKKSSVVPLESKPSLRKGSGTISSVKPAVKKRVSSSPQELLTKSEDLTLDEENGAVANFTDLAIQHEEKETGGKNTATEYGTTVGSPKKSDEGIGQVDPPTVGDIDKAVEPELIAEDEVESMISPTAWAEIEELEDQPVTSGDHNCQMMSPPVYTVPVRVSSPRVHHSLSQMLLEESSEPDIVDWGIAENPPEMVYHKDSPKGLKRLLKFARKSKTEANAAGWSSLSVFSEGEDDSEDSKFANKRNSGNLLRKATLHSKNGHQKNSTGYEHSAQRNTGKLNSQQIQDGLVSASVTTTKASRSFFSLSAFKGSK